MKNIKGGVGAARTITLMITCKLKTNLFIFAGQDGAVELPGFIPPLGGSVAEFFLLLDVLIRIFISNSPVVESHLLHALSPYK